MTEPTKEANNTVADANADTAIKELSDNLEPKGPPAFIRDIFRFHGSSPRGSDFFPSSQLFEGRFGRMFRTLHPARFVEADLKLLGARMIAEHEDVATPETESDDEENTGISAGYTYLGQFIDHDLTFDPASSLQKQNDPDALVDFRTPRFDLDNIYGRGPDDQPYLYQGDGVKLLLGRPLTGNDDPASCDLPRNNPDEGGGTSGRRRALIGDPRNDENVIVSQLQALMLRFHNHMVDVLSAKHADDPAFRDPKTLFTQAQRAVRWHYQWIVVNDFLSTIAGPEIVDTLLPHLRKGTAIDDDPPQLKFFNWHKEPYMPIEFSVAAYRFGHSMVRPIYRLNQTLPVRQAIFAPDENASLTGFRAFPDSWALDWSLFFDLGIKGQPTSGPARLQHSYKIDTSLVNPLGNLPDVIGANVPSLAERNLIRGWRMGLPSGQAVARKMGITPIP
ncbi:MAG: peroxidase family protein, partial [Pyrinomonadaceae bacterium]